MLGIQAQWIARLRTHDGPTDVGLEAGAAQWSVNIEFVGWALLPDGGGRVGVPILL